MMQLIQQFQLKITYSGVVLDSGNVLESDSNPYFRTRTPTRTLKTQIRTRAIPWTISVVYNVLISLLVHCLCVCVFFLVGQCGYSQLLCQLCQGYTK